MNEVGLVSDFFCCNTETIPDFFLVSNLEVS